MRYVNARDEPLHGDGLPNMVSHLRVGDGRYLGRRASDGETRHEQDGSDERRAWHERLPEGGRLPNKLRGPRAARTVGTGGAAGGAGVIIPTAHGRRRR